MHDCLDIDVRPPSKGWLFVFEGLGSLACALYGNYVFFFFRDQYGFGDLGNLGLAATMGLTIALASWQGGRLAQARGCLKVIVLGQVGMTATLVVGGLSSSRLVQLGVMVVWTASQFIVWPALEALIVEDTSWKARPRLLGVYCIVWAACSAFSYFCGGVLFECLGGRAIFWLPPGFYLVQLGIIWIYGQRCRRSRKLEPEPARPPSCEGAARTGLTPGPRLFQRMAWLANPFACIAIFTLLAMIPNLASRLGLSTKAAGWFCSIWFFARLAAFIGLRQWRGWHYRFRWLLLGYVGLMAGFGTAAASENLLWLGLGQILFGLAIGLLYYSSLFYSIDVGEARAKHGGIHEALMGAGNFVGPGVGAAGLMLAPNSPHASVWAVCGLLALGLLALTGMRLGPKWWW